LKKIFWFLYGPIIAVIYFFMQQYKANRERLDKIVSKERMSALLQGLAVIVLLIWIITFYFAPDEKRNVLTQEIKQSFEKLKSTVD